MRINESCTNWTMQYNNVLLKDLDKDSDEYKVLAAILHLSGDIIALYTNVPATIAEELRTTILNTLSIIFSETKDQIVQYIDQVVSLDASQAPLEPEYDHDVIFGLQLKESLKANLKNKAEEQIADNHFQIIDVSESEEEDTDEPL